MKDQDYLFSIDLKVRDYECDLQGVVNNANYQHYMEHTRHEFLESLGESFSGMHEAGIDAFVYKVSITYKKSLRGGDRFRSALNCYKKGAKLIFEQYILFPDGTVSAHGEIETVAVENGVITRGEVFDKLLEGIERKK
jgi:thioesterase family protein